MAWLWLLFPVVILVLTVGLWRATVALRRERSELQSEVDALEPLADQARGANGPTTPGRATGREQVDR
jgi:cytochrome c-type biogenesis protein CcmH/NrfF